MRKNMPYPKKRLKEKKERKIHRVRVFGGTENKIYYFFVLLVPMFWEADKNKLFDFIFIFILASNEKIII
jgi:hypothetical protein